ncbi:hypothetical protein [Hungatella hathewayi]|uniref:hypothetical protein n=1 Tax=Hungatella hathewayi TaxID=154046 RepID=UPI003568AB3D
MGLNINIVALKRSKLNEMQMKYLGYQLEHLYEDFFLESHSGENDTNQFGTWIASLSRDIFKDFFEQVGFSIKYEELMVIDEVTYKRMFQWLEKKLKDTTLMDLVNAEIDPCDPGLVDLIMVYKDMKRTNMDFNEDVLIIEYS